MQRLPAEVLAALPRATRRSVRAEWSNDGGTTWTECRVARGSAQVRPDRTAQCRWSGSVDLLDAPTGRDGINTVATQLRLFEGVTAPRTGTVWVPAGRYVVDRVRTGRLATAVDLLGLEDVIRTASLPTPRTVDADSARVQATALIGEALPTAPISWRDGIDPDTRMPAFVVDEDRWQGVSGGTDTSGTATGIAASLGGEVWADARGVIAFGPVPTVDDPVAWRLPYGQGLVTAEPEQTAEGLANLWVISGDGGEGAAAVGPVFVWDDDPASLTWAGPDPVNDPLAPQRMGLAQVRLRVARYASPLITTDQQAYTVGRARLADSLGVQSSLSFTAYSHPGIEPGDVVEAETSPGVWERHIIDACPRTLGAASMTCTTRTSTRRL